MSDGISNARKILSEWDKEIQRDTLLKLYSHDYSNVADTYFKMGVAYYDNNIFDRAIKHYTEAL